MTNYSWLPLIAGLYQQGASQNVRCCHGHNTAFKEVMSQYEAAGSSNKNFEGIPKSMDEIFQKAADTYHVPVNLLKAIGKSESNFTPDAVSSAGAMGVMQLMPRTAQSLGVTDPFDAEQNIMGGAKLIAQHLKDYDGNLDLALAAYSAGIGNVEKYGGVPPFEETQNYIKKIKSYMGEDIQTGKTVNSTVCFSETKNQEDQSECCCCTGSSMYGMSTENSRYLGELMKLMLLSNVDMTGGSSGLL